MRSHANDRPDCCESRFANSLTPLIGLLAPCWLAIIVAPDNYGFTSSSCRCTLERSRFGVSLRVALLVVVCACGSLELLFNPPTVRQPFSVV